MKKKMPIGIDDFAEIMTQGFYYVDKTGMIKELLENWGKVNLFTRPRRFGKSMNMSMLKYFFEIGTDKSLFTGLEIARETALCEEYMGQFPVVSVTFKGIEGKDYETARCMAVDMINEEARRLDFLAESDKLSGQEKQLYMRLIDENMVDKTLFSSLRNLTELLEKHYGKKVILLIDEYDVPLAKASEYDYYDEMIQLIRSMFNQALKTNRSLYFAVMTGCLRISKESIFTGLNNPLILSITDVQFDEYFGFSDQEVQDALEYYGLSHRYEDIKNWYDGYQFGNVKVYNPWDIICCLYDLKANPDARLKDYWSNTSDNHLVRTFVQKAGTGQTKAEIESLLAGETITKDIHEDLTYHNLYDSIDNIWSVLFMTGYLTMRGEVGEKGYELAIPNREIHNIFTDQIMTLFKEKVKNDGTRLKNFCNALENGRAEDVEKFFTAYLNDIISIRDTFVQKERKESFYHGILLGILGFRDGWYVRSNRESRDGYADILVEIESREIGIIIEVKYADKAKYSDAIIEAFAQIERENYAAGLRDDGFRTIYKYGIACFKKRCRVKLEKETFETK